MRLVLILSFCFLSGINIIKAQDLIVTKKGDSLNCKITKIKSDYIYFTFKYDNEIRHTLLAVDQVKYYKKDFYAKAEVPAGKIKNYYDDYQRFKIGVYGGWSYMTAKISSSVPSVLHDYMSDLKSGYHFGADFNYFLSENYGFGFIYSMFKTSNQIDNIYITNTITGQTRSGILKDDISVQYFGPSFCTRIITANKKIQFVSDISIGYLWYKNYAAVIDNFTITSGNLGVYYNIGADFAIESNLSFGISLAYFIGTLTQYDYDDGIKTTTIELDKDNIENISRLDISAGLKWNLK